MIPTTEFHDFLVDGFNNPIAVDKTLQQLGAAVLVGGEDNYLKQDGCYVMRVFGNPGYIKFAVEHQGYCRIVRELAKPK